EPAPDLQDMVRATASRFEAMNATLGLFNWGRKVFEREQGHDPGQWQERLPQGRGGQEHAGDDWEPGGGGAGMAAAVSARDHWDEMSADERGWCIGTVCAEVARDADTWNELARVQRGAMDGDRPCAWVAPALVGKALEQDDRQRVLRTLALALT